MKFRIAAVVALVLMACTSSTGTVPGGATTAGDAGADAADDAPSSLSCSASYAPDGAYTGDCALGYGDTPASGMHDADAYDADAYDAASD